ncbi:MAG TPA: hypothetical protein VG411_08895 [Actinomycetota bacterium]|nr:hypothetical protein [Actinomycetota bacterium]
MHPTHPRRRPWPAVLLLLVTALLVALAAVVVVAPPAGADSLTGAEPSNYQTRVLGVRPALDGVSVEVADAGTRLRLHNRSDREVVVLGYAGEPWLRVQPGQSATWHDHRAHWEAQEPPAQVRRSPGSAQVAVPEWTVKLRTGRRLADVVGEVRWVPGPSPLPWLAGAAVLAMAVVAAGRGRRWLGALVAALALVVGLDLVQLAGAWIGARPPLAGKLLGLGASAAGWVLAALAVRQLLRRRLESGLFQLLLAAGLLTVVSGLGDLGFLLRSQLASGLPDAIVRAAVTAKLGLGIGALTAAALQLRSLLSAQARAAAGAEGMERMEGADGIEGPAGAVDNHRHARHPSATLPHRGGRYPQPGLEGASFEGAPVGGARLWDWDDEPLGFEAWDDQGPPSDERFGTALVPELHVVGGRASRGRQPATTAPSTTLATVLPWPGHRRPGTFDDDPDLPGGA